MANPSRSAQLLFCRIDLGDDWISTVFPDGSKYGALPHDTPEYRALTERCGYGSDIWAYCRGHEIAHSVVAEYVYHAPSRVIWGCAHGKWAAPADILHEEELSVSLQAFARAGVLPGSSAPGFSWFVLRDRYLKVCDELAA